MSERWAAVEIMGHRQHVGRIGEESVAGVKLLRIEVLQRDGTFEAVSYGGASIFSIKDVTEERARVEVMRKDWQPCDEYREPSALPGRCGTCGYTVPEHEAHKAKALPAHEDESPPDSEDEPPPWDAVSSEEVPRG